MDGSVRISLGIAAFGVLALAMVPLYQWYAERARQFDAEPPMAYDLGAPRPASTAPPPALSAKVYYRWGEKLPAGYHCAAAGGLVYRTFKMPDGSTGLDPLVRDGQHVRCAGDYRSSYR
jgi:hypothetical protein